VEGILRGVTLIMNDNNDFKFSPISISKEEIDYLSERWEIRDHGEIFSWAIKLLFDLSKLDEAGWRFFLQKCDLDPITNKFVEDEKFTSLGFLIEWLAPLNDSFVRLPTVESLEKVTRVKGVEKEKE
jgi:hypothetical protein